ncbi:glycosyl hydrolases family 31-domain-containing protein [Polychytrium aggregatum]|uniref:glycosyl hydrolases family 31-domain-containing protein n=1 Tax=Polychytrium aggregatum TaxID=110093 RepID=UPI0022FF080F|nr:glycosyl hydrolases family 31-domain-containing protein [Polychytrium aggregatum]KAI9204856.1 glycosyl hydrolases family 31-domain-containing protein [Polychytrium aggregatum]
MLAALLLAILGLAVSSVMAVKQHDFKLCHQSGFCSRQRAVAELVEKFPTLGPNYKFIESSLKLGKAGVEFKIVEQSHIGGSVQPGGDELLVTLDILKAAGTVRVRADPVVAKDQKPRYKSDEFVLTSVPEKSNLKVASANDKDVHYEWTHDSAKYAFVVEKSPFTIRFYVNGDEAISMNDHDLFFYENQIVKEEPAPAPPADQNAAAEDKKVDERSDDEKEFDRLKEAVRKDQWAEQFGSHHDSKPHGPTSIGLDISFPGSKHVYGIPEHATSFALKPTRGEISGEPYRLYNFDVFEYELNSPMALYGSIPFMLSHKKGQTVGVFWQNPSEMWIDVEHKSADSTTSHWMVESGSFDIFVFLGPHAAAVLDSYTSLTGRAAMPQSFAIAYHQCRWNYLDEADVQGVDGNFEKHDIPYDVLWLDIEHTDGKRYFTWDNAKFPNPANMQSDLAVKGRKMVTIIDPHIKKDDNYHVSSEAKSAGIFVKNKDGSDYEGWCWPGSSNWIDYTNAAARSFWSKKFLYNQYEGSTPTLYTWNDMNEPSVFNGPEITMPKDLVHHDNVEHRDVHNIYGMLQHRSTYEGHLLRSIDNDRPFILSRAFFAGSQRYGAIWTGDNFARWDHLEASVPMLLSIGIAGQSFSGADVGGFFGDPEPELMVRWFQTAAFQPFYRGHAHIDTKRREPWIYGEPFTGHIRSAIRTRYQLLPYIYTLFRESTVSGTPVMRPLWYAFPDDEATFAVDDEFMLGSAFLIKPVVQKDTAETEVLLPAGSNWYDYETLVKVDPSASGKLNVKTPLDKLPVFLRGGSIVPRRDRIRRSSALTIKDPYTLVIALDEKGEALGEFYNDDGRSFDYKKGDYVYAQLEFRDNTLRCTSPVAKYTDVSAKISKPKFTGHDSRVERLIIVGVHSKPKRVVSSSGANLEFTFAREGGVVVVKEPQGVFGKEWHVAFEF